MSHQLGNAISPRWTSEETAKLMMLVSVLGPHWSIIAKQLGRTVASCRNRWLRLSSDKTAKNRCSICHKPKRGHVCTATETTPQMRALDALIPEID